MGIYINPPHEAKETWLSKHGVHVTSMRGARYDQIPEDCVAVVLILNPAFSAAGVAFNEEEFGVFTRPGDPRPRELYLVKRKDLTEEIIGADGVEILARGGY